MNKVNLKPMTILGPVPSVMVSCIGPLDQTNIITIAWTGIVCSEPPTLSISVRKERYSYRLIKETGDFVVNIPTTNQVYETDYCGYISGRDRDKFRELKFTPTRGKFVKSPLIAECPINIECRVKSVISLGTHDMFIAEIVAVNVDEDKVSDGRLVLDPQQFFSYFRGEYRSVGNLINTQGSYKK